MSERLKTIYLKVYFRFEDTVYEDISPEMLLDDYLCHPTAEGIETELMNPETETVVSKKQLEAAERMACLLEEMSKYLDYNKLTSIGHRSIFHDTMKDYVEQYQEAKGES